MEALNDFVSEIKEIVANNTVFAENSTPDGIQCVWKNVFRSKDIIFNIMKATRLPKDERCFVTLLMLTNVLTDVINAALAICQGFWRGPGIILRGAWEDMACAIVIKNDSDKYHRFKNGKFPATEAITPAKEIFPEFGEHYGLSSKVYAHTEYDFIGRCNFRTEKGDRVVLTPTVDSTRSLYVPLLQCALIARYVGAIAELCSVGLIDEFYYWRKMADDSLITYHDTEEDDLIKNLEKKATKLLESEGQS